MTVAAFLVAMVGPMMARILTSLGVSLITITGLTVALSELKDQVSSMLSGMSNAAIQMGGLLGIWQALGIIFGSLTFCVTWKATTGFMALAKT